MKYKKKVFRCGKVQKIFIFPSKRPFLCFFYRDYKV